MADIEAIASGEKARFQGLAWDAILNMRGHQAVMLTPVDGAGQPVGRGSFAALDSPADPMWRPSDEHVARYIGEFTPSHRERLWKWLHRRASNIAWAVLFANATGPLGAMGDHAMDAQDDMIEEALDDPHEWLDDTPFMQALAALIIGDGNAHVLLGHAKPPRVAGNDGPDWWDL